MPTERPCGSDVASTVERDASVVGRSAPARVERAMRSFRDVLRTLPELGCDARVEALAERSAGPAARG
jgi:hypothetical protein